MPRRTIHTLISRSLNESPSEKEGKYPSDAVHSHNKKPSMKVPPKRKGNVFLRTAAPCCLPLNESPSEKEGKCP